MEVEVRYLATLSSLLRGADGLLVLLLFFFFFFTSLTSLSLPNTAQIETEEVSILDFNRKGTKLPSRSGAMNIRNDFSAEMGCYIFVH